MTTLPRLYERWMTEALGGSVRGEPRSTCTDCAMCPKDPSDPLPHFRPDVKCCGYRPYFPNFLVGAVLRDAEHPEGQRTMRARLGDAVGATPVGLGGDPAYRDRQRDTPFGSAFDLRCPHFSPDGGGTCTVWAHREAVCATWFCRVDRGLTAHHFWMTTKKLLESVEMALATACAVWLGADPPEGWGRWAAADEAYYVACADLVDRLSWDDVLAVGGLDAAMLLHEVRDWHEAREHPELPDRVRHVGVTALALADGRKRLRTWSPYDAVDVAPDVLARLPVLDGLSTFRILADGLLDRDTLQALVDHVVLVDGGDTAALDAFGVDDADDPWS